MPKSPVLSLHALQGLQGHNTMRFSAVIDQIEVVVLVDSGSTHNFIDFKVESVNTLRVMVANGVRLSTQWLCKAVPWEAQGNQFMIDFLLLSVKGFDLVLGIQWLLSLGPISSQLPPDLFELLDEFDDVFNSPIRLPPSCLQDHKIPLLDEAKVVKVKPYRYPAIQKT
ncbi:Retrovirus-related Pol polyprotein from transposon 297 family [Gossypium australe]|uniref:Retrovirus-related Pol polyprotein from transposon 297 family n=1 Tax=Gossypium australe TaxID=47621 RepID=A0A5B6X6G6_9ROSI|nr:Retrovirus-related Pol polyprotein from transposon 297 family [Gossypium australe]